MHWHYLNWVILAIYLLLLLSVGVYFSIKKGKSSEDYFVGGRKIPYWASSLSLYATGLSSISYISITSNVYRNGWVFAMAPIGISFLIIFVAWIFVPFTRREGHGITVYEYLEERFSRSLRIMGSLTFIVYHIFRISVVIYLPTLALKESLPSVNPTFLVCIVGFLCVIYTTIGGFEAVVWTDVVQTFIFIFSAILIIFIGISSIPRDIGNPIKILLEDNKIYTPNDWKFDISTANIWTLIIGGFFSSIYQYIGSQDMVQRYNSTRTLKEARKSVLLNIPLSFTSVIMYVGMASGIYLFYKFHSGDPSLSNPNSIVPFFVINHVPFIFSGIVIAGIFSASQSTISSSLNSVSTCITTDFISPIFPKLRDLDKINISKFFSWIIGICGTLFAVRFIIVGPGDVYLLFNSVIGLFGSPIAAIFLIGIFSSRVDHRAAWFGFFCSIMLSIYISDPHKVVSMIIPGYKKPNIFPLMVAFFVIPFGMITSYFSSFIFGKQRNLDHKKLTIKYLIKEK